jgi:NAD(P)-dependent dehydrogenase (short-subunit alcohol dehydrogenase family)
MAEDHTMKKGTEIFNLAGKTALITGATGYLGSAMASVLAEAGAHILVNSRSQEPCDALVKAIVDSGGTAEAAVFDVTDEKALTAYFKAKQEIPLHILINNAYVGGAGSIELSTAAAYADSYSVVVKAAHNILNAALPSLREAVKQSGEASVINLTSMYAMVSPDHRIYKTEKEVNPPYYGAAKAALLQWTRYAACEFGCEGIRINALSPGPFPNETTQAGNADFIERLSSKVPLGRIGQAQEIKGPTLFLASAASSYVNGANIVVDGGWTCW